MIGRLVNLLRRRRQRTHLIGRVGEGTRIETTARFEHHVGLDIGRFCRIGPDCFISAEGGVTIGDGTIFGPSVVVYSSTHRYGQDAMLPYDQFDEPRPVRIGRGVWLAHQVLVAPGTTIGDGVVAGMGAVLSGTIADGSIVVGNPARVVARRPEGDVERLVAEERYYLNETAKRGLRRTLIAPTPE